MKNIDTQKHLGVLIANELQFDNHVERLCKKESQHLHYMSIRQIQFGCCTIVLMFHRRTLNRRINITHGRSLTLVYEDYNSSFEDELYFCNNSSNDEL